MYIHVIWEKSQYKNVKVNFTVVVKIRFEWVQGKSLFQQILVPAREDLLDT